MRLTKQANYAVRILMYCAANADGLSKVATIAKVYDVSEYFLFKILQPLVESGYIETVRGRSGGIRMAKSAADITLGEVIRAAEDKFIMAECFEEDATSCPLLSSCAFNSALSEALGAFFKVLDSYTIEDLVVNKSRVRELLGMFGMEEGEVAAVS
ncbi:MAG: iron-responsive transcriptional regulator RirA [Hyphomicrobiales bacterium]